MPDWKIPAIIGGASFFFAVFLGLLSGVAFGMVLARSLGTALTASLLSMGMAYILNTYLLESSGSTEEGMSEDQSDTDTKVDIVLAEENPLETPVNQNSQDEDSDEEAVEVIEGDLKDSPGPDPSRDMERMSAMDSLGDMDTLPDMESFSSDFAEGTFVEDNENGISPSESPRTRGGEVDVAGMESSPDEIAKAVRTIMKKDDQG